MNTRPHCYELGTARALGELRRPERVTRLGAWIAAGLATALIAVVALLR